MSRRRRLRRGGGSAKAEVNVALVCEYMMKGFRDEMVRTIVTAILHKFPHHKGNINLFALTTDEALANRVSIALDAELLLMSDMPAAAKSAMSLSPVWKGMIVAHTLRAGAQSDASDFLVVATTRNKFQPDYRPRMAEARAAQLLARKLRVNMHVMVLNEDDGWCSHYFNRPCWSAANDKHEVKADMIEHLQEVKEDAKQTKTDTTSAAGGTATGTSATTKRSDANLPFPLLI